MAVNSSSFSIFNICLFYYFLYYTTQVSIFGTGIYGKTIICFQKLQNYFSRFL